MATRIPFQNEVIRDETSNADIILDEASNYVYDQTTGARTVISTARTVIGATRGVASGRVVV